MRTILAAALLAAAALPATAVAAVAPPDVLVLMQSYGASAKPVGGGACSVQLEVRNTGGEWSYLVADGAVQCTETPRFIDQTMNWSGAFPTKDFAAERVTGEQTAAMRVYQPHGTPGTYVTYCAKVTPQVGATETVCAQTLWKARNERLFY